MKLWTDAKKIFSYFAFFDTERQLRDYQKNFQYRESSYQHQIANKERMIQELRDKIIALEFEKHASDQETKKHFLEMNYLQKKLADTKRQCQQFRSELSNLHSTYDNLVNSLQSGSLKEPFRATVSHHH